MNLFECSRRHGCMGSCGQLEVEEARVSGEKVTDHYPPTCHNQVSNLGQQRWDRKLTALCKPWIFFNEKQPHYCSGIRLQPWAQGQSMNTSALLFLFAELWKSIILSNRQARLKETKILFSRFCISCTSENADQPAPMYSVVWKHLVRASCFVWVHITPFVKGYSTFFENWSKKVVSGLV